MALILCTILAPKVIAPKSQAKKPRLDTDVGNSGKMDVYTQCSNFKITLTEEEKEEAEDVLRNSHGMNRYDLYKKTRSYQRSFIGTPGFEIKDFNKKFDWLDEVRMHSNLLHCKFLPHENYGDWELRELLGKTALSAKKGCKNIGETP